LFIDSTTILHLPSPNHRIQQKPTDHRLSDFDHCRVSRVVNVSPIWTLLAIAIVAVAVAVVVALMVVVSLSVSQAVTVGRHQVDVLRDE
jgi:hypothetical protein